MFRTQFQRERVRSKVGSGVKILYAPVFDENGVMDLVESGREDLYAYIQSHKDSCDIHVILKRYSEGDPSVLSKVQGMYGDFTNMPQTYAEALNAIISAENYFNTLPVDVRAKFGHSFQQFLVSMDKPDFLERMGVSPVPPESTPTPSQDSPQTASESPSAASSAAE